MSILRHCLKAMASIMQFYFYFFAIVLNLYILFVLFFPSAAHNKKSFDLRMRFYHLDGFQDASLFFRDNTMFLPLNFQRKVTSSGEEKWDQLLTTTTNSRWSLSCLQMEGI